MSKRKNGATRSSESWDAVADWYTGWVGARGSEHHRKLAIPAVLDLLGTVEGHEILDVGCGTAALARSVLKAGGKYTGVDASRRLLAYARRHQGDVPRFIHADATRLHEIVDLSSATFDAVVFLLSIQDIDPLGTALESAAWALRRGGRMVILMTHPCFRIPRQSGWGWDRGRQLQFRRIDRYMTPLVVPMKSYGPHRRGATRSHHRPLEDYVAALARQGLLVEAVREIPADDTIARGPATKAERRARREIPLFMGLRAVKQ